MSRFPGVRRHRLLLCEWFAAKGEAHPLHEEGGAIRDALFAGLHDVPDLVVSLVVSHSARAPAGVEVLRAPPGEALPPFILRAAEQYDMSLIVAPESDGLLASLARGIDSARWLGCLPEAIEIASSKQTTLKVLHNAGIRTPLAIGHCAKWVVKPDDGVGAINVRVHECLVQAKRDYSARSARGERSTFEPWVDGEARSLSLLCGMREARLLSVNRQQVRLDGDGSVSFIGVDSAALPPSPELADLAARVHATLPGLRGLVGIDYVENPQHGAVVVEINPRPTSAYVGLASKLGWSPVAEWLALHLREFRD